VAEIVMPPRTVFVQFPFGSPVGEPGNIEQQQAVVTDALKFLATAEEPGAILDLPYKWRA